MMGMYEIVLECRYSKPEEQNKRSDKSRKNRNGTRNKTKRKEKQRKIEKITVGRPKRHLAVAREKNRGD
jgi:hypothetical protein